MRFYILSIVFGYSNNHDGNNCVGCNVNRFQKARTRTLIRRIQHIDYNDEENRTEFQIVKGGDGHDFVSIKLNSKVGNGINSTILFYGPMP